jgi:hypothetical protein
MTTTSSKEFVLTIIRQWRNPLLALAVPMGEVLRQRQFGVIVLAMPQWIADGILIDALALSVRNVSRIRTAVIPGTMFSPVLARPNAIDLTIHNIRTYACERRLVVLVGYPLRTVFEPTPDKVRGFAPGADYVVHTSPEIGDSGMQMFFVKVHPCTSHLPKRAVTVRTADIDAGVPLDWLGRELGATIMTRSAA